MKSLLIIVLISLNAALITATGTFIGKSIAQIDDAKKDAEIAEQNARNGLRK